MGGVLVRWSILFLLVSICVGQTGPHRKVFSASPNVCTRFNSSGIINSQTNGQIGIGIAQPTITFSEVFNTGDVILLGAINNGGSASAINPVLNDTHSLTFNVIQINFNNGIWYTVIGSGFTGESITVAFQHQSLNRSITGVHLSATAIPSLGSGGNSGTFPAVPSFTFNSSSVVFNLAGTSGQAWLFGGIGVPASATFLHGLFVAVITSPADASTPPTNWANIIVSGLPSTSISYSCSFP